MLLPHTWDLIPSAGEEAFSTRKNFPLGEGEKFDFSPAAGIRHFQLLIEAQGTPEVRPCSEVL